MRILIVEDEVKIRKGMSNFIENHTEHTVAGEAKNGEEGLELALKYDPDLIITDIRMPVMDGLKMIQLLAEQGALKHCVILTGYSEFDYAKQAIRYGVDDYLVKPLAPEDVTGLLEQIQNKMTKELRKQMGTPEKKLRDILLGSNETTEQMQELKLLCEFSEEAELKLLCAYIGTAGQKDKNICLERFEKIKNEFTGQKFYCFFLENTKEFICIAEDKNWDIIRTVLEQKLLNNSLLETKWVWIEQHLSQLNQLRDTYQSVQECYLYSMILTSRRFMRIEDIKHLVLQEYQYPYLLEHEMQNAFYSGKKENIAEAGRRFIEDDSHLQADPNRVKEGYIKFAGFLLELSKESNQLMYEQLQSLNLMKNMGLAMTVTDLKRILEEEIKAVNSYMDKREDISNYTIKRAIDYIRNYYGEGISLEAVADNLDITSEYLSTLFNREMGVNFSAFLKKFRISHAKRLLKATDMKIYEIALLVGYSDPKYFNRVFKEEEGISPGDFRNLHW